MTLTFVKKCRIQNLWKEGYKKSLVSKMLGLYIFLFSFLIFSVSFATARNYSLFDTSSVRYSDNYRQYLNTPRIPCLAICDGTDGCLSVNHNSDTNICELTAQHPNVLLPTSVFEPNWRVYYQGRYIHAVTAWQSHSFVDGTYDLSAGLAVDGSRVNHYPACAHTATGNSYWAMEFERAAEVSYVIIYFRDYLDTNYRNANLRLLVSATRQDSDDSVGTDCAFYVGPPLIPATPVIVSCTRPVTGKFLKIIPDLEDYLTLCEVEVYSV